VNTYTGKGSLIGKRKNQSKHRFSGARCFEDLGRQNRRKRKSKAETWNLSRHGREKKDLFENCGLQEVTVLPDIKVKGRGKKNKIMRTLRHGRREKEESRFSTSS